MSPIIQTIMNGSFKQCIGQGQDQKKSDSFSMAMSDLKENYNGHWPRNFVKKIFINVLFFIFCVL